MNTPDKFNFERFGLATRQYFSYNKKQLLGGMLATLGFLTLIAFAIGNHYEEQYDRCIQNVHYWESPETIYMKTVEIEALAFTCCFFLFTVIAGSLTFSSFNSKKKRITSLMLPMAKSEMFILRILIYTVLANVMFIGCCSAADVLRSILVFGPTIWTSHAIIFSDRFLTSALPIILSSAFFGQALYTLGAAMWPRNSFIITFGVLFAAQLIFIPIIENITDLFVSIVEFLHIDEILAASLIIFTMAIGVYWLAWLRFKRYQIILKL